MPFYEYSCPQCGFEKEVLHGISATPEVACERCEEQPMQRLVSAAGFRLKGGGWYETDFKSDKRRNVAGDGSDKSSGGAETSTGSGGDKAASGGSGDSGGSGKGGGDKASSGGSGEAGKSSSAAAAS